MRLLAIGRRASTQPCRYDRAQQEEHMGSGQPSHLPGEPGDVAGHPTNSWASRWQKALFDGEARLEWRGRRGRMGSMVEEIGKRKSIATMPGMRTRALRRGARPLRRRPAILPTGPQCCRPHRLGGIELGGGAVGQGEAGNGHGGHAQGEDRGSLRRSWGAAIRCGATQGELFGRRGRSGGHPTARKDQTTRSRCCWWSHWTSMTPTR